MIMNSNSNVKRLRECKGIIKKTYYHLPSSGNQRLSLQDATQQRLQNLAPFHLGASIYNTTDSMYVQSTALYSYISCIHIHLFSHLQAALGPQSHQPRRISICNPANPPGEPEACGEHPRSSPFPARGHKLLILIRYPI